MKCLLIDDEPKALEILRKYVERVHFLELAEAFRDPVHALAYLAAQPVDLIFLDVNMPDMSGIQFLNALHTRPLVIFTTAYSDYAVRSYDYDAVEVRARSHHSPGAAPATRKERGGTQCRRCRGAERIG
jgi:two-component system LytT family response regulator